MKMRTDAVAGRMPTDVQSQGVVGAVTDGMWLGKRIGERAEWAFLEAGIPFEDDLSSAEQMGRFLVRTWPVRGMR